jgi:hypothetical protein
MWQSALVVRRASAISAVLALGVAAVSGAAAAPSSAPSPSCALAVGEPVVLRSSDFDPDVLVWDSHDRAIDYAGGAVHDATDVLNHTLLSKPGTRAIVIACLPATARPKYTSVVLDTVGVKLTDGPHRGRYGWVTSDDVRNSNTALVPSAP